MCNVPGDCFLTYDPKCTELHSDSSDFEDTNATPVSPKNGNHSLFNKKFYSKSKRNLNTESCNSRVYTVTEGTSREMWESQTIISKYGKEIDLEVRQCYQNKKSKILDSGDQIETIKSKRSLMRHKVIPCLSSMFGRSSNNVKQMSIIKENQVENVNIDNGCQAGCVNCEHKMRKFNRRQQCYAVQPVYAVEGNIHAKSTPFQHTKIVREPLLTHRTVGDDYNNLSYSLTSSSEEVEPRRFLHRRKGKTKKYKNVESEMEEEYNNMKYYEGPNLKNTEQQCPSKMNRKTPYYVYTSNQCQRTNTGCSPIPSNQISNSELPSTCSGFWEYLINKINTKYQTQSPTLFKPCKCNSPPEAPVPPKVSSNCNPSKCPNFSQSGSQPVYSHPDTGQLDPCSCHTLRQQESPPNNMQNKSPTAPPLKTKSSPAAKEAPSIKVECKCYPDKKSFFSKASPEGSQAAAGSPAQPTRSPMGPPVRSPMGPPVRSPMGPPVKSPMGSPARSPMGSPVKSPMEPPIEEEKKRPCQVAHDDITETLTQKYNGEILCIHNPPCVLINGCLNLPPPKEEISAGFWPVSQDSQTGFHQMYTRTYSTKQQGIPSLESHCLHQCQITDESCQYFPPAMEVKTYRNMDEGCQYQVPSLELQQFKITDEGCQYRHSHLGTEANTFMNHENCQYFPQIDIHKYRTSQEKREKFVQSICNHNPPCEVVRTCCKPKYDPKLQNSCVHVPMCEKVPLCLMELKNQNQEVSSCAHKPKCAEVPVCTRNYIILTAKEEAGTQVRPKAKMVCRHEPPCIMIPKCLARVCDSCIPFDAIPDCIHQPMCEMIPACCRKSAKEMVSVCSQYPNQCCIV